MVLGNQLAFLTVVHLLTYVKILAEKKNVYK